MKKNIHFCSFVVATYALMLKLQIQLATEVWHPVPRMVTFQGTSRCRAMPLYFWWQQPGTMDKRRDGSKAMWEVKGWHFTVKGVREISKTKQNLDRASSTSNSVRQLWWKATVRAGATVVFSFQEKYEVQILDNYNNSTTPIAGQCAAVYKQHIPLVNACKALVSGRRMILFSLPLFLIRMG